MDGEVDVHAGGSYGGSTGCWADQFIQCLHRWRADHQQLRLQWRKSLTIDHDYFEHDRWHNVRHLVG